MTRSEVSKRLEAIRCWLAPDERSVRTAKAELESLIRDLNCRPGDPDLPDKD